MPTYSTRWYKELRPSDVQQVKPGTNPTGKLRLCKTKHAIDCRRYFRYQLFGAAHWDTTVRRGNTYDVVNIEFDVKILGKHFGATTFTIDHAPHREANQKNIPTVLAWGQLNRVMIRTSHVGDWVVIDRDSGGQFKLAIQSHQP